MPVTQAKDLVKEKPITSEQEVKELLDKLILHKNERPPVEDAIAKAEAVVKAAAKVKVKQKVRQTWCCTECGHPHIQLYLDGKGHGSSHFSVDLEDGEPVDDSGSPLSGERAKNMTIAMEGTHGSGDGPSQVARLERERKQKE